MIYIMKPTTKLGKTFHVLISLEIKISVFWDVPPSNFIDGYRRLG
jgi:hypothetical protein